HVRKRPIRRVRNVIDVVLRLDLGIAVGRLEHPGLRARVLRARGELEAPHAGILLLRDFDLDRIRLARLVFLREARDDEIAEAGRASGVEVVALMTLHARPLTETASLSSRRALRIC